MKRVKGLSVFVVILICLSWAYPNGKTGFKNANNESYSPADSPNLGKVLDEIASRMVKIDGGAYTMGCTPEQDSDCRENELQTKDVTIGSFNLSKYEVTQAEWVAIMGDNPSKNEGCMDCPVENLSLSDIKSFIAKLNTLSGKNYRLPTQEEWEFAARGGVKTKKFKYAGSNNLDEIAWYNETSDGKSHTVGQKKPNELGLYDMSGNVYEWCSDEYVRGGSYLSSGNYCRVPCKATMSGDYKYDDNGLRLAIN